MALSQTFFARRSSHVLNQPQNPTMKYQSISILLAIAIVSCDKNDPVESTSSSPKHSVPSSALKAVIGATVAGEAKSIHMARESAKPGDAITVAGRVMGAQNPFVEGRAAFILGDPALLTPCNERPDDHCQTPWDNCCDSKENKKRGTATIQIVDAEGRVLKEPIEGVEGIAKLSRLVVSGTVATGSTPDLLIINATAIDSAP